MRPPHVSAQLVVGASGRVHSPGGIGGRTEVVVAVCIGARPRLALRQSMNACTTSLLVGSLIGLGEIVAKVAKSLNDRAEAVRDGIFATLAPLPSPHRAGREVGANPVSERLDAPCLDLHPHECIPKLG